MRKQILYVFVTCILCNYVEQVLAQEIEIEYETLCSSDVIDMLHIPLCTPPGLGVCTVMEGELVGLDSNVYDGAMKLPVPSDTLVQTISTTNNGFLLKINNQAVWIDVASSQVSRISFEDSDFTLFPGMDSLFYVQRIGDTLMVEINRFNQKIQRGIVVDAPVTALKALPDKSIVLSASNNLWLVSESKKTKLHSHPSVINDFALTPWGTFLATQDGLWMLDYHGILHHLGSETIQRTLFTALSLYVVDKQGNLVVIHITNK